MGISRALLCWLGETRCGDEMLRFTSLVLRRWHGCACFLHRRETRRQAATLFVCINLDFVVLLHTFFCCCSRLRKAFVGNSIVSIQYPHVNLMDVFPLLL